MLGTMIHHGIKMYFEGYFCGSVVENLPADAGDVGSIPDLGRFHTLWSK